jgi:peptidoglycan/LPS O-acetylase OafA/YrhL
VPADRARGTSTVNLGTVEPRRDNNFDVLRLFAAGLVVFSHSFPLTGRHEPLMPHSLGRTGVEIFFATSGFLVTKSWFSDPSPRRFAARRALRIMPGLIVAVLVTAFLFGPLFTSGSPQHYFASPAPWVYSIANITLQQMTILPSVFTHNPFPSANGSLWSLPIEVIAYVLLAMAATLGALRSRRVLIAGLAVAVSASAAAPGHWGFRLVSVFFGAVVLYMYRDRVPLRTDLALVLMALWVGSFSTRFSAAVAVIALPYLVAFVAYRSPKRLRRLCAAGDVSYGVYIYAFLIQQSLVATFGAINPYLLFGATLPIVWLIALASWRLVERPALARKPRAPRIESAEGKIPRPHSASILAGTEAGSP